VWRWHSVWRRAGRWADLIVANNVLAHVPDINDFVAGISHLLKPDGVATFEFRIWCGWSNTASFDTIYHEHFSYLSLTPSARFFSATDLRYSMSRNCQPMGESAGVRPTPGHR